jgi:hypothetical protein
MTPTGDIVLVLSPETHSLYEEGCWAEFPSHEAMKTFRVVQDSVRDMHLAAGAAGLTLGGCVEIRCECKCPAPRHDGPACPVVPHARVEEKS